MTKSQLLLEKIARLSPREMQALSSGLANAKNTPKATILDELGGFAKNPGTTRNAATSGKTLMEEVGGAASSASNSLGQKAKTGLSRAGALIRRNPLAAAATLGTTGLAVGTYAGSRNRN